MCYVPDIAIMTRAEDCVRVLQALRRPAALVEGARRDATPPTLAAKHAFWRGRDLGFPLGTNKAVKSLYGCQVGRVRKHMKTKANLMLVSVVLAAAAFGYGAIADPLPP